MPRPTNPSVCAKQASSLQVPITAIPCQAACKSGEVQLSKSPLQNHVLHHDNNRQDKGIDIGKGIRLFAYCQSTHVVLQECGFRKSSASFQNTEQTGLNI